MAAKTLLGLAATVVSLLLLEAGFRLFHVESDGFHHTHASQRWMARHWKPVNRRGYRDVDHDLAGSSAARPLFVTGDSFVAGDGIEDPSDRFADRLAEHLGDEVVLHVVAKPGWNTAQQVRALEGHPLRPRILVVSYYLNDIEDAARRHGRTLDFDLTVRPPWLERLVDASSLANFVYWRVARARMGDAGRRYADWVYAAFRDPEIWPDHAAELDALVAPARRSGVLVHAVVFPHLFDLDGSSDAVARVRAHFEQQGVPVLDVLELIREGDWSPRDLVVGPVDPHPSIALHRAVGDALAERVAH